MSDIHTHFVWGLDDGASSLEDSLAMLPTAAGDGITDIVATPHSNARYLFQPALLRRRTQELARRGEPMPVLHSGCEFHLTSDTIGPLLDSPPPTPSSPAPTCFSNSPTSTLAGTPSPSFRSCSMPAASLSVAHPERNPVLLRDLRRLELGRLELGCLTQFTARSISGWIRRHPSLRRPPPAGPRSRFTWSQSGAHNPQYRPPTLSAAFQAVRARLGEETAELLFTENPRGIIQGRPRPEAAGGSSARPRAGGGSLNGGPASIRIKSTDIVNQ